MVIWYIGEKASDRHLQIPTNRIRASEKPLGAASEAVPIRKLRDLYLVVFNPQNERTDHKSLLAAPHVYGQQPDVGKRGLGVDPLNAQNCCRARTGHDSSFSPVEGSTLWGSFECLNWCKTITAPEGVRVKLLYWMGDEVEVIEVAPPIWRNPWNSVWYSSLSMSTLYNLNPITERESIILFRMPLVISNQIPWEVDKLERPCKNLQMMIVSIGSGIPCNLWRNAIAEPTDSIVLAERSFWCRDVRNRIMWKGRTGRVVWTSRIFLLKVSKLAHTLPYWVQIDGDNDLWKTSLIEAMRLLVSDVWDNDWIPLRLWM